MKTNLNYFFSSIIVGTLKQLGLKHVCISPGSRNTPITLAFAANDFIKKHLIIDERASAFFALGIAKITREPVAVVCTSGTAVAELYSAIIEAYNSQIPLIVLTADRPSRLLNTGSNQTINQIGIFKSNCDFFYNLKIDEPSESRFLETIFELGTAWSNSLFPYPGPVQINLPFEKPLEPDTFNVEIDDDTVLRLKDTVSQLGVQNFYKDLAYGRGYEFEISSDSNTLILLGNDNYTDVFIQDCVQLSQKYSIPVCLESPLLNPTALKPGIIRNFGNLLQSTEFVEKLEIDKIIIFGRNFTSKNIERFLDRFKNKILKISQKGEGFGEFSESRDIANVSNEDAIKILDGLLTNPSKARNSFYNLLQSFDSRFAAQMVKQFGEDNISSELEAMASLAHLLDGFSTVPVFFSNSLPVRDYDYLKEMFRNPVLVSRGASGIDGILATAGGISTGSGSPSILVVGDIAFHYDSNSLQFIKRYTIPLLIILINNGGGSIFEYLPVYKESEEFSTYFKTETGLNFGNLVRAYGIDYKLISTVSEFKASVDNFFKTPSPMVIELQFDSQISKKRKDTIKNDIISSLKVN